MNRDELWWQLAAPANPNSVCEWCGRYTRNPDFVDVHGLCEQCFALYDEAIDALLGKGNIND